MNASPAKKSWIAALAALPALSACAGAPDGDSAALSYPRWRDFPTAAADAPPPRVVAARVATLHVSGAAAAGEAARIDWTLADAAGYAAAAQDRATPPPPPDGAPSPAELEARARALRDRAVAPPPVDRH